jgi:serine-type D-Ala-D-Ala carboxypeptidase/endopeptidase (penicillin-binding protein 4)
VALVAVGAAIVLVALKGPGGSPSAAASAGRAGATASPTGKSASPGTTSTASTAAGSSTVAGAAPPTAAELSLRRALRKAMKQAGPDSGALVYDLRSSTPLYSQRAAVRRPPASVEKLWTTTALMLKLGPAARLKTTVLGVGRLRGHVWHGSLYLRGGGDPTFGDATFNHNWEQGYGPTAAQLVTQLQALGIRSVSGHVYGDESLFDRRRGGLLTHYAPDVPDFGGQLSALTYDHGYTPAHYSPATFAAHQLVMTMRTAKIRARAARSSAKTPARARLLATVSSPPLSVLTRLMDVPSDDLFAELLTKQLGVLFGHGGSISAGAAVISSTIVSTYDLHPRILDGSGLSRSDRSSPLEVVDLLSKLWQTAVGNELKASLPLVGEQGTVATIAAHTAARGRCVAKTGTLDYVTNLAGYCDSRGHAPVAFAVFIDGPGNWTALTLLGRIVTAIARY